MNLQYADLAPERARQVISSSDEGEDAVPARLFGAGQDALQQQGAPIISSRRLRCEEIWGGISLADTDVCTRGLCASILSSACGSETGGDIYYFSVCSSDLLTRMALADMRGHGADASRLSGALYKSLQSRMNTLNGGGVLEDLNEEVHRHGFSALTTAAVLSYYVATGKMYFSYAGHPPLFIRNGEAGWRPLVLEDESPRANLPLGVMRGTRYDQIELRSGDRLFVYTDGVLECPDASGDEFGEHRLLSVLRRTEKVSLSETKEAVTRALRAHAGGDFAHDDCTFVIAEIR